MEEGLINIIKNAKEHVSIFKLKMLLVHLQTWLVLTLTKHFQEKWKPNVDHRK
jgi:hypothetical protein